MLKKYRYIWLPAALLIYGIAMLLIFHGRTLRNPDRDTLPLWGFLIVDIAVCVLLAVFLKKRYK